MGCKRLHIYGIVQGVGFRPFVYRLAHECGLKGYVLNFGNGVEVLIEGDEEQMEIFLHDLKTKKPPLSRIDRIEIKTAPKINFSDFTIRESEKSNRIESSIIPPDVHICDECLGEMLDLNDRRYHHPFTVCTNCGPRYTMVSHLPYDRQNTTMVDFPLCKLCSEEYASPMDRRYHAQPTCCSDCGPKTMLYDDAGALVIESDRSDAIVRTAELLDEGGVIAIKGVGGIHIAVKVTDDAPLLRLRKRLGRDEQPFAVMARDLHTAKGFALVNQTEEQVLTSYRRPMVVLDKSGEYYFSELVAPGLHNIGVMLPYTGLHHLLFRALKEPTCVMTSANLPRRPMVKDNAVAFEKLNGIVDYYLLHNRRIANRADDTVARVVCGRTKFIRRSRGYVPEPIVLPFVLEKDALGVGAEWDVTISIVHDDWAYLSQYVGNTREIETLQYHNEVVEHLKRLTRISPDIYGCDLHPLFNTTRYAMENAKSVKVQHHHAHLVSLMIDNGLSIDSEIVGIAVDGVGYGPDGTIWGGEIIVAGYGDFTRCASLETQPMPGGDLAAHYPSRMALGILNKVLSDDELAKVKLRFKHEKEKQIIIEQLRQDVNVMRTTSTGRVLDAVSALLGITYYRSYEGEPAMKLESAARGGKDVLDIPIRFKTEDSRRVLDTTQVLLSVYDGLGTYSKSDLAFSTEDAIATGLAELAIDVAKKQNIETVGISGGVSYNAHITRRIWELVEERGFGFIMHDRIPNGDGGISLGQAIVASLRKHVQSHFLWKIFI
ncbi:MAG: carbamoyltransferase HypF [Methanosarcinales archaeon Met12]|nr:MAG: carbamoyltransferase HypF [Methanosarcinales archaeon Met12]